MSEPQSILSILCDEPWRLDSNEECQMRFYRDGAGEIILLHEFRSWIAAETEWKCLDDAEVLGRNATASQEDGAFKEDKGKLEFIADFSIEITITKRVITTRGSTEGLYLNDFWLKDEAFMPKRYSVRLETGIFITTLEAKLNAIPRWAPRFKYRLSFDRSPYPQLEDWKDPDREEQYLLPQPFLPYTEWRELCSVELEEEAQSEER